MSNGNPPGKTPEQIERAKRRHLVYPPNGSFYEDSSGNPPKRYAVNNVTPTEILAVPVYIIDPTVNPVAMMGRNIWSGGSLKWLQDATLNNSNKTFTVPDDKIWGLHGALLEFTTTATVGSRRLVFSISNLTPAVVWEGTITSAIVASTTTRMKIAAGLSAEAGEIDVNVLLVRSIPSPCLLPAGYVIRVWDSLAIDPAADDLTVNLHYTEYDA